MFEPDASAEKKNAAIHTILKNEIELLYRCI